MGASPIWSIQLGAKSAEPKMGANLNCEKKKSPNLTIGTLRFRMGLNLNI